MSYPKSAIVVDNYQELNRFAEAFANEKINLMIVVGRAGVGKSEAIRHAVPDSACWLEGNATAFGMYEAIHEHQDQLVVIDDVDGLYSDRAAVRLLKSLCNTRPEKRLTWHSRATGGFLPSEFVTRSKVCIIANDWKTLDENVAAIVDRGQFVAFEPSAQEVHSQTRKWIEDEVVFNWLGEHLNFFPELSMRTYWRATELKNAGFPWQSMLLSHVPEKLRIAIEVLGRPDLTTEAERIDLFCKKTGASRATYFNTKKRLILD